MKENKYNFILDKAGSKNEQPVTAISPKEILDEHTEQLIEENDRLEERMIELEKKIPLYSYVVREGFINDETFGMLVEKWLRIVREKT